MKIKPFSIELSDEAEDDFDKSYEFYFKDSPKVADAFFNQINLDFDTIRQNPQSFPVAHKDVRRYTVKKVPICDLLSNCRYINTGNCNFPYK